PQNIPPWFQLRWSPSVARLRTQKQHQFKREPFELEKATRRNQRMRNRQQTIAGLLLAVLLVLGCQMAFAQGIVTGSIAGTVVDSTGAIIPGAKVTATQTETNTTTTVTSNESGYFLFPKLQPGTYNV